MVASGRAGASGHFLELLRPVSLSPQWATCRPHHCRRPSNTSRQIWSGLLCGHGLFPLGPGTHRLLCVPLHPQEWSLCFPQSCGSHAILLSFKTRLSGDLSSCYQPPRLGSPMQDSEPSLQWENCGIIVIQFVGQLPGRYWIWLYCYALTGLSFIFGCRISFLAGSSIFPSMVAQQLATACALARRSLNTK